MHPTSADVIFLMLGRLSKTDYQLTELGPEILGDLEEEEFGDEGYD